MKDLELGMLVVGAVSLAAAVIVVGSTGVHLVRERPSDRRVKVWLAACQAGLLAPLGLLLFGYVYSWADMSTSAYAVTGVAASLACGAGLAWLPRNSAR